ncbi:MAG TPA: response regulator [Flavisolibacter sp.]|nr:response regulator [Flavisolibacter sp.]
MTNGINFSILLVDDDAEDRQIIDEAFVEIGNACDIKKFISGADLLNYLKNLEPELYPSLIVLDLTMPELNAIELLGILKQNEAYKDIPVIVYSSHCTPSKKAELKALGAYDFIEKGDTMQAIIDMAKRFTALSKEQTRDVS